MAFAEKNLPLNGDMCGESVVIIRLFGGDGQRADGNGQRPDGNRQRADGNGRRFGRNGQRADGR